MRSPENVLKSLSEKAKNKEYRYERLYRVQTDSLLTV